MTNTQQTMTSFSAGSTIAAAAATATAYDPSFDLRTEPLETRQLTR